MFFLARQSKNISNNIKILLCQRLYICSSYNLSVMIGFQLVNYQLLLEQFTLTYMYNANIMSELPFGRKTLHFCNLQHCKTSLQHYKVIPHYHVSSITKKIEKYINIHKIKNEEHICVTNKNFKISTSCSPVFPSSSVLEPPLERRNLVMI